MVIFTKIATVFAICVSVLYLSDNGVVPWAYMQIIATATFIAFCLMRALDESALKSRSTGKDKDWSAWSFRIDDVCAADIAEDKAQSVFASSTVVSCDSHYEAIRRTLLEIEKALANRITQAR